MPKAIRIDSVHNRTTGLALPGQFRGKPATVAQQVHDGDTINVVANGNIGVRLLGIDTPEISFAFPGPKLRFLPLEDAAWTEFLSTAFEDRWGPFDVPDELRNWLQFRLHAGTSVDHHQHAVRATDGLRELVTADMQVMGQDLTQFGYYMGFGFEVMDAYGRFLCIINRNQPDRWEPTPRPPSYNFRLLERGLAFPYFIWPNVNPWDRPDSIAAAVLAPGTARDMAAQNRELRAARAAVQSARERHLGLFDAMVPCQLEPFELRFLARRALPARHVIDLNANGNELIPPQEYHRVPLPEDRLWIPDIYVPLFQQHGWK